MASRSSNGVFKAETMVPKLKVKRELKARSENELK
jgi:hypothetical protein